ncbi:preprotein translocase subunit SecA, partial [Candidatus Saccharibacteria bacterium]|nr:preprotein translocase subunit SecA [Candidatus Saccharibacteria bacterium]
MTKKTERAGEVAVKKKVRKEKKPTDKLADKTALTKFLQGVFGDAQKKVLRRMWRRAQDINKLESKYEKMDDNELREQTEVFRRKIEKALKVAKAEEGINKSGKKRPPVDDTKILNELLPEVFAVAREAAKRVLGLRPYDVQLIGGMVLHEGAVAEMKTGEGKTLVAMLPAYLNGLTGRGVHVVTVNDYLAQRDAGWNGPVYDFLGMSVGVIINNASFVYDAEYENEEHDDERFRHLRPATRKEAYNADITYGTNNEFGFDYLRDNMTSEVQYLRQRELNFAIVDEVDSILIDEARTPLIISAPAGDNPESYYQFAKVAARLTPEDYIFDEKRRSVTLTDSGIEKVQEILGVENLYSTKNTRLVYHLEQAIRAEVVFKHDKDYVVTNSGEVIIV